MTSTIKERPILFSGPMVRAILEGRKTVTRRLVKGGQYPVFNGDEPEHGMPWTAVGQHHPRYGFCVSGKTEEECAAELGEKGVCPHGRPGDRLWVRESFFAFGRWETRFSQKKGRDEWHFIDMTLDTGRQYQYDQPEGQDFIPARSDITPAWWRRPSIHMPRHASRILLEVRQVRVERLQDISLLQVRAEGCEVREFWLFGADAAASQKIGSRVFGGLWAAINGQDSWNANPWVWVVEFKRVTP